MHSTKQDFDEHDQPITNIVDAAKRKACKRCFCKLDCSEAYHCFQMAKEQSIQFLSYRFGSQMFA